MTVSSSTFLALLALASLVSAEIRSFHGIIEADSEVIHYSEGYLIAPGFIDLSALVFKTLPDDDDENTDSGETSDTDDTPTGGGGGGNRQLDDVGGHGSIIDIAFFGEPSDCAYSRSGCDWTKLGIGAEDSQEGLSWCCNNDAIALNLCTQQAFGRLIVNSTAFKGQHRFVPVPDSGYMETHVKYGQLEEPNNSGKYILVIANCNDVEGRNIRVDGQYTWKSRHGYLPGDLFGEMYFFLALAVLYFILLVWYGISIKLYEDSIIPIQPWIITTIGLGFLEVFFKTGDYFVWNVDGVRFWFSTYTGVILGVLKRSISLSLIVMVSMGWGVVRDSLGGAMKKIIALGVVYAGVELARDVFTIFAVTENQTLSINEEEELFDVVIILALVGYVLDIIWYLWILESLGSTMEYLENMNQMRKLRRFLRLRCILLISILAAVIWGVFSTVDNFVEERMVDQESRWAVSASMEINYLFVLAGVAILWRPNPNAKDYAFVMEIPATTNDNGEVELTMEGVIPSAADEDDDDLALEETSNGSYRDRVPVEDAVHS